MTDTAPHVVQIDSKARLKAVARLAVIEGHKEAKTVLKGLAERAGARCRGGRIYVPGRDMYQARGWDRFIEQITAGGSDIAGVVEDMIIHATRAGSTVTLSAELVASIRARSGKSTTTTKEAAMTEPTIDRAAEIRAELDQLDVDARAAGRAGETEMAADIDCDRERLHSELMRLGTVRYPKGSPEHARYEAELSAELTKFAEREAPYDVEPEMKPDHRPSRLIFGDDAAGDVEAITEHITDGTTRPNAGAPLSVWERATADDAVGTFARAVTECRRIGVPDEILRTSTALGSGLVGFAKEIRYLTQIVMPNALEDAAAGKATMFYQPRETAPAEVVATRVAVGYPATSRSDYLAIHAMPKLPEMFAAVRGEQRGTEGRRAIDELAELVDQVIPGFAATARLAWLKAEGIADDSDLTCRVCGVELPGIGQHDAARHNAISDHVEPESEPVADGPEHSPGAANVLDDVECADPRHCPLIDGDGETVPVPECFTGNLNEARPFYRGRVRVACGHYTSKSERDAGFKTCERC